MALSVLGGLESYAPEVLRPSQLSLKANKNFESFKSQVEVNQTGARRGRRNEDFARAQLVK